MKARPRPRTKAEDVPAPTRTQFERFVRKLVSVPKHELNRRESENQRERSKKQKAKP